MTQFTEEPFAEDGKQQKGLVCLLRTPTMITEIKRKKIREHTIVYVI